MQKFIDSLVLKSKAILVKDYLDPAAAQFSNLVFVINTRKEKTMTLCGSVNGKNAYGGYVGPKMFYVQWSEMELDQPKIVVWNDEIVKNISSGRAEDAKWDADLANMKALLANSKRNSALLICEPAKNLGKRGGLYFKDPDRTQNEIDDLDTGKVFINVD